MRIYGNGNRLGFLAVMRASYPVVERLGSEVWFEQRALQYQPRYPSRSGDLQHVGAHFAEYLQAELSDTGYEYLADVARLEWAYQEALTAAESDSLDPAALGAVAADDYERLVFVPCSALRLVDSPYPVLTIWKAHQAGAELIEIKLDSGSSRVLVIRRDDHVELRELPVASFALLNQFMHGVALGEAVEAVLADDADIDVGAGLRQLMTLACFRAFRLRTTVSCSTDFPQLSGSIP